MARRPLSPEQIAEINKSDASCEETAKLYGISPGRVNEIRGGSGYKTMMFADYVKMLRNTRDDSGRSAARSASDE